MFRIVRRTDVNTARVDACGRTRSTVAERTDPVDSLADKMPAFGRVITGHLGRVRSTLQPRVLRRRDIRTASH